jgi:TetR/AcrR family transcriptional regulator
MRDACSHTRHLLDELLHADGVFADRLRHFAEAHLQRLFDQPEMARLIQREVMKSDRRRGRALAERVFGTNFARLVAFFRDAQQRGEMRCDVDPAMAAILLISADVFFFQAQHVLQHLESARFAKDPKIYSTLLADLLLHGIGATSVPVDSPGMGN